MYEKATINLLLQMGKPRQNVSAVPWISTTLRSTKLKRKVYMTEFQVLSASLISICSVDSLEIQLLHIAGT